MSEIDYAALAEEVHANAVRHGFWDGDIGDEFLGWALVHAEVSEVLEATRDGLEPYFEGDDGKPEGVAVELADVAIRCLDILGAAGVTDQEFVRALIDNNIEKLGSTSITGLLVCLLHEIASLQIQPEVRAWSLVIACEQIVQEQFPDLVWEEVIRAKMAYNASRPYLHGKRF